MIDCRNKTIKEVAEIVARLKQHDYTLKEIEKILIF